MKQTTLWKISVTTLAEAEDAVAELLGTAFGQPASSYTDADTRQVTVSQSIFRTGQPGLAASKKGTRVWAWNGSPASGLDIGPGSISLKRIRQEDWAESWKRHFKPLVIGSALLLKPSWSRRRPRKGQAVVVLDPGLSFGTGRHPTTAFCLRQLVARRRRGEAQSCLDIGTGSGILAIAAAKLGYAPSGRVGLRSRVDPHRPRQRASEWRVRQDSLSAAGFDQAAAPKRAEILGGLRQPGLEPADGRTGTDSGPFARRTACWWSQAS